MWGYLKSIVYQGHSYLRRSNNLTCKINKYWYAASHCRTSPEPHEIIGTLGWRSSWTKFVSCCNKCFSLVITALLFTVSIDSCIFLLHTLCACSARIFPVSVFWYYFFFLEKSKGHTLICIVAKFCYISSSIYHTTGL